MVVNRTFKMDGSATCWYMYCKYKEKRSVRNTDADISKPIYRQLQYGIYGTKGSVCKSRTVQYDRCPLKNTLRGNQQRRNIEPESRNINAATGNLCFKTDNKLRSVLSKTN